MSVPEVIDLASDTTRADLCRLANLHALPEFVKQASMESLNEPPTKLSTAYADPVNLKFACHTPAATWLSNLYFQDQKAQYAPADRERIEQRLHKFAAFFGIENEFAATNEKIASETTPALPDDDYAYVWKGDDGSVQRFYPLTSALQVKAAADWLYRVRDHMILEHRTVVADKILEKAGKFGAGLSEEVTTYLDRQVGHGVPDIEQVSEMLLERKTFAKDATMRHNLESLAETVRRTPQMFLQPADALKLASVVEELDAALGLRGRYTSSIKRPEDVIFDCTYTKIAKDMYQLCPLQTGSVYEKTQFAKLSRDEISNLLGPDALDDFWPGLEIDTEKFAEVAATLPRPDAEMLERLLAEQGERPQLRKSAGAMALPTQELERLAVQFERRLSAELGSPQHGELS